MNCECGCGATVKANRRFVHGHNARREHHPRWRGRKSLTGYEMIRADGHPRADVNGFLLEHIAVAESALGHGLPAGAVVHHVNGNRADNRPQNLVVCQDTAYHLLLHRRERALLACGNKHWRLCKYCSEYMDPSHPEARGLYDKPYPSPYHLTCQREWQRRRRARLLED